MGGDNRMKSKEVKRREATLRQKRYDSMSDEQKIDHLNKGNYRAEKERKRKGFPPL